MDTYLYARYLPIQGFINTQGFNNGDCVDLSEFNLLQSEFLFRGK